MTQLTSDKTLIRWSHLNITQVPIDIHGIYIFWCRDNGKCIYVGKAKQRPVRVRLKEHWNGADNATLNLWIKTFGANLDVCYARVPTNKIDKFEIKLIRRLRPEANDLHNDRR